MTTTTMDAIYEDGVLRLEEPMDLENRTRVRVRIEIPEPIAEGVLPMRESDRRRSAMTPANRDLFDRVRSLREKMGPIDMDIVEELRDIREHG